MLNDIKLLGTELSLLQGQHIWITPALNQPEPAGKWFAQPVGVLWPHPAPQYQSEDTSILIKDEDFEFIG